MSEVNMVSITVTQGLRERKVLRDRISRSINEGVFVSVVEGEAKRPASKAYRDLESLKATIQSSTDSVNGLINRYNAIVDALIASNASTTVTIAGVSMTVAAAIERRNSFEMSLNFLNAIQNQHNRCVTEVNTKQVVLDRAIESRILNNKTDSMDAAQVQQVSLDAKTVLDRESKPEVYDPMKNAENLKGLRSEAEAFMDELETQLNIVNATTMISVPA